MAVDYKVISADSHVLEPPEMWQKYVASEFVDRAPRLVRDKDTDRLECDMADLPPVGLLAGCARGDDEVRAEGRWDEDVFVGGYDPEARLKDLERDGVDAEVLFPTIGMQMYPIPDQDFQWALFRAYNSWMADFVSTAPERFKGIGMLNHEDVDNAIAELKRCHELGLSGVMVPLFAGEDNPYYQPELDPLWAAAVEHGMPINLHAATTRDKSKAWNKGTPTDAVLKMTEIQRVVLDMIHFGLFDRFPELKVVSVENDAGWAGAVIERADYRYKRGRNIHTITNKRLPSEYFRDNIRMTFMRDFTAIAARDVIGVESLMWGSDFPHHVSTWPNSQAVLAEHFEGVPDEVRHQIVCGNVRELFGF